MTQKIEDYIRGMNIIARTFPQTKLRYSVTFTDTARAFRVDTVERAKEVMNLCADERVGCEVWDTNDGEHHDLWLLVGRVRYIYIGDYYETEYDFHNGLKKRKTTTIKDIKDYLRKNEVKL